MVNFILLISLWFNLAHPSPVKLESAVDANYRCAKYMVYIDFSRIMSIVPESPPGITSFSYYIQYGDDIVIEISDPGMEIPYLSVIKAEWHYKDEFAYVETLLRSSQMYYPKKDTLTFCISESRGDVEELCKSAFYGGPCDTLLFKSIFTEYPFLVYSSKDIPNIHSTDLFYPDIEYLPIKISPKNPDRAMMILDQVIYGKQAVDSILRVFNHNGYEALTDKDIEFAKRMNPIEDVIKLSEQTKKKSD